MKGRAIVNFLKALPGPSGAVRNPDGLPSLDRRRFSSDVDQAEPATQAPFPRASFKRHSAASQAMAFPRCRGVLRRCGSCRKRKWKRPVSQIQ